MPALVEARVWCARRRRSDLRGYLHRGNMAQSGNIYQNRKAKNVPGTLYEAIELAKKSKLLPKIFHSDVLDHYIHAAKWEQSEYDKSVNDWEHRRYFERG